MLDVRLGGTVRSAPALVVVADRELLRKLLDVLRLRDRQGLSLAVARDLHANELGGFAEYLDMSVERGRVGGGEVVEVFACGGGCGAWRLIMDLRISSCLVLSCPKSLLAGSHSDRRRMEERQKLNE